MTDANADLGVNPLEDTSSYAAIAYAEERRENIRTFVRVYELGSMSAAGRDLRISPAVTSARISQLEDQLDLN